MILPLAYSMIYGSSPTPDQVQVRFWFFIFLLSSPALVIYALSKIEGDEFKASFFTWLLGVALVLGIVAPTAGPAPVWMVSLSVLVPCSGLELCRYGPVRKSVGVLGLMGGFFIVRWLIRSSFTHFMMTGRIL